MKVLIAGDFCPRDRVAVLFENGDYDKVLSDARYLTNDADYSIINYECPVVLGDAKPIAKCGPNLRSTPKGVQAIKWAGFNCVTLANNHFMDFGKAGVKDTFETLKDNGIDSVGGGTNLEEASRTLFKQIKGKLLAIINCCEHEFSIATDKTAGCNPLNPIQQFYAIKNAKEKADRVIIIVHGGHEHFQLPSPRMVETYRFLIDAGADAVINHHQHCYSGYEVYKGKPIFYGLGNFCFDNPTIHEGMWTEGYAVSINFGDGNTTFTIHPYCQCSEKPSIKILENEAFEKRLNELNSIIADESKLRKEVYNYYYSKSFLLGWMFEPYRNGLFFRLRHKKILPSFLRKSDKLYFYNQLLCEAYYDRIRWWLEHQAL